MTPVEAPRYPYTSSLTRKGQGIIFRAPKTHRSARSVALSPLTVEILQSHRWQQLRERQTLGDGYEDSGLIFCTLLGSPVDSSNLRRSWERITKDAGLPGLRFHDLRHSHATFMLKEGINPKIVSERLGHADISFTLNTYSHVLPGLQAEAAAALDQLFAKNDEGHAFRT